MPDQLITKNNRTLVQTASSWPTDDSGWITLEDAWATDFVDGFCNDMGAADFFYPIGDILNEGDGVAATRTAPSLGGKYVRISTEDPSGPIIADDGTTFTAAWAGVVESISIEPDPDNNGMSYRAKCSGGMAILDQCQPARHYAEPNTGDIAAEIGSAAVFNMVGNKKTGNRSQDQFDFGGGYTSYIFDFSGDRNSTSSHWQDTDKLQYFLAIAAHESPGGPPFSVTGQTDVLLRVAQNDIVGLSVCEMFNQTLSPKNGTGYWCYYDYESNGFIIDVMSLSKTDIPVVSEIPEYDDYTIPANDRQKTLDLSPATGIPRWKIDENQATKCDEVVVSFDPPWYTVTFDLNQFEPDWEASDVTARESLIDEDKEDPALDQARIARVGRRFRLKHDWDGNTSSGFVMPFSRLRTTDDLHGEMGWSGELSDDDVDDFDYGQAIVKGSSFVITKTLCMPEGYDWAVENGAQQDPTFSDLSKDYMAPVVIVKFSSGDYVMLKDVCKVQEIQVKVDEETAAFDLGPSSIVDTVLSLIDTGAQIYFTLGIKAQMNSLVSWRKPTADGLDRDKRRSITKNRNSLKRMFLTTDVKLGIRQDILQTSGSTQLTIRDDKTVANTALASLLPWFSQSEFTVSRSMQGTITTDDFSPGDMITSASFLFSDGSTVAVPMVAIVSSVNRDTTGEGNVKISCKRITFGVEAFS